MKFACFRVEAWGIKLLSKRNRDMNEIKDRKNSFGRESSVNNDLPAFNCPHVYIVHSKRGGGRKQTILTWYKE